MTAPCARCGGDTTAGICWECALPEAECGCRPRQQDNAAPPGSPEPLAWAHIIDWHQAWAGKPDHVEWLVEPLLERGTSNAWFGKPAAGKSLIALEAAAGLAAGRPVLGAPAQDPVTVLYVDVENAVNGIVERLQAFGYDPGDLKRLVYSSFPDVPGLDTFAGGQFLLQAAEAHNPALVIIDTTSRIIAGKENDADTFLQLYRHALVPLKQRGITVLRLDHPGKDVDRGQRGSSAKDGDVDTVWLVERVPESGVNFERHKSRNDHGAGSLYLTRKSGPLRHEPGAFGMPPRAVDILAALAELGAPADITNRAAAKLLREDGKRVRGADLTVALRKWRETEGNTLFPAGLETLGNTETEDPGPECFPFPERSEETGNRLPPEPAP
jgi:AAA domain